MWYKQIYKYTYAYHKYIILVFIKLTWTFKSANKSEIDVNNKPNSKFDLENWS